MQQTPDNADNAEKKIGGQKKGFQVKDLITTALMIVCALLLWGVSTLLALTPYTIALSVPLWAVLAPITFFLVAAKTNSPWMLFLFGAALSFVGLYPPMIVCWLAAAFAVLLITKKYGATNAKSLTLGWILYTVAFGFGGQYVPFLFFSEQTMAQYAGTYGVENMNIVAALSTPQFAVLMLCVTALCAFIGSLIAKKLLKKHFQKAGVA